MAAAAGTRAHRGTTSRTCERFLAELAKTGNVTQACEEARVSRFHIYERRNRDPEFATKWDDAIDQAGDHLEQEAYRRAVLGWDEAVFMPSGFVGTVHKYDSSLLALMLKAAKPEKYRENIKVSGTIEHSLVPTGSARALVVEMLEAVKNIPAAREAVALRLLASGE